MKGFALLNVIIPVVMIVIFCSLFYFMFVVEPTYWCNELCDEDYKGKAIIYPFSREYKCETHDAFMYEPLGPCYDEDGWPVSCSNLEWIKVCRFREPGYS